MRTLRATFSSLSISLVLLLGLGACGGDDLDQQTASLAMTEAMTAASSAYSKISVELGKVDGTWVSGSAADFAIKGTVNSPQGGTADVTGTGSKTGNSYVMNLKLNFKDWKGSQGIVLNGVLELKYNIQSITGMKMNISYKGDLTVSGSASGTASFDMEITYSGMASYCVKGTVGGISINQGTGC